MKHVIISAAMLAVVVTSVPASADIPERCALLGDSAMTALERWSGTKAAIEELLADDTMSQEVKRRRYVDILFERDQQATAALEKLILLVDCAQNG